jgi:hypothetical protein
MMEVKYEKVKVRTSLFVGPFKEMFILTLEKQNIKSASRCFVLKLEIIYLFLVILKVCGKKFGFEGSLRSLNWFKECHFLFTDFGIRLLLWAMRRLILRCMSTWI